MEDIVQLLDFTPKKTKATKNKNDDGKQNVLNCNLLVSKAYPLSIRNTVALIDEDSHHLDIIEVIST